MIKRLTSRMGILKLYPLSKNMQDNLNVTNSTIQSIKAKTIFFEENGRLDLIFEFNGKEREFELSFDIFDVNNPANFQYLHDENFEFPRLKLLKGEFIISGLFEDKKQKWLAVGKFPGPIPDGYAYHEDELTYETIFPI